MASPGQPDDDPLLVLRQARERFIESFPGRVSSIRVLLEGDAGPGESPGLDAARRIAHQMTGLAGTVGFPSVSERSAEIEQLLLLAPTLGVPQQAMADALAALTEAFTLDVAAPVPDWAVPVETSSGPTLLLVEDDPLQRRVVGTSLQAAGYRIVEADNGITAVDVARATRPALVLLDIDLPGADGYSVCRALRTSPDLSGTPVIFMTTRASVGDRLTGLTLGADDYLVKPVDAKELVLRISLLLKRAAPARPTASEASLLTYEAFATAAQGLLSLDGAAVALVRLPREGQEAARTRLVDDLRRRDFAGSYGPNHIVLIMPGLSAATACARLRDAIEPLRAAGSTEMAAGVAASVAAGAVSVEDLLAEADDALGAARYLGEAASTKPSTGGVARSQDASARATVVLADDDPDVIRIVDAQIRAAGYATTLAFDGAAALAATETKRPDILVLDLMMPKMTGFDVLAKIRMLERRPKIIVLSGRGREEDVTRAFELGADDYMTKPFSPPELIARLSRLLR